MRNFFQLAFKATFNMSACSFHVRQWIYPTAFRWEQYILSIYSSAPAVSISIGKIYNFSQRAVIMHLLRVRFSIIFSFCAFCVVTTYASFIALSECTAQRYQYVISGHLLLTHYPNDAVLVICYMKLQLEPLPSYWNEHRTIHANRKSRFSVLGPHCKPRSTMAQPLSQALKLDKGNNTSQLLDGRYK